MMNRIGTTTRLGHTRPVIAPRLESRLSAAALIGVLLAASMSGIADEEWRGLDGPDDPGSDEIYSDPWSTEYEDPFATYDPAYDPQVGEDAPDRFRLYDETGRSSGRAERAPIGDGDYRLYDDAGRSSGRVSRNPLREGSYSVFDERGRRVREIRESPYSEGHYDVYDKRGRRIGRIEESPLVDGQYDIYDEKGRRIGRAEGD